MNSDKLIERLADNQHEIWSHWMSYLFTKCATNDDGSVTIPADLVERWKKQIATPYAELTEKEKQSDRNQALKVIKAYGVNCNDRLTEDDF